jgi:hypothetical protein
MVKKVRAQTAPRFLGIELNLSFRFLGYQDDVWNSSMLVEIASNDAFVVRGYCHPSSVHDDEFPRVELPQPEAAVVVEGALPKVGDEVFNIGILLT